VRQVPDAMIVPGCPCTSASASAERSATWQGYGHAGPRGNQATVDATGGCGPVHAVPQRRDHADLGTSVLHRVAR
jgi:hypothetical protein